MEGPPAHNTAGTILGGSSFQEGTRPTAYQGQPGEM